MGVGLLGQDDTEAYYRALKRPNTALLIGNGVNLSNKETSSLSWQTLVSQLAIARGIHLSNEVLKNAALTEVADILSLSDETKYQLRNDAISLLQASAIHTPPIAKFAHENGIPILTTNFDLNLVNNSLRFPTKKRRLGGNPNREKRVPSGWDIFRGEKQSEEFARNVTGLWNIHGSIDTKNAFLLTSANYMKAISRAHLLINKTGLYGKIDCDFGMCRGCKSCSWGGQTTWLDAFFHRNLVVVGFSFGKAETFLRYLLLERWKYLVYKYGNADLVPRSTFVTYSENSLEPDELFYFQNLGLEVIHLETDVHAFSNLPRFKENE